MPMQEEPQPELGSTQVHDIDLYCLNCGYNIRGLSGDPVRCPECFHMNPIGDVEIPAPIISAQLRRMETAPAVCVGAAIVGMLFVPLAIVVIVVSIRGPTRELDAVACTGVLALAALVAWITGVASFRSSCLGKPGWAAVLLRYHVWGVALVALVAGVFAGAYSLLRRLAVPYGVGGTYLLAMLLICVLVILGILYGVRRVHPRMKAGMEQLQREVAVTLARERTRRELQRRKRRGLFG